MPAKTTGKDNSRRLTDFFAQRPSASVPPLVRSSGSHPTGTDSMTPTARKRPATRPSKTAVDCESSTSSSAPPQLRSVSMMGARKRPRSPDTNDPSISPLPPPKLKSPKKPGHSKAVVYVTSPFPCRNSLAQRNATPATSPSNSSKQVVYSSQSDEAELVLPMPQSHNRGKVVESVHAWRRKATESSGLSTSTVTEDAIEFGPLLSSPVRNSPSTSALGVSPRFDTPVRPAVGFKGSPADQTPIVASTCLPSPADTDEFPSLPPTPEPMDPEAKAAKLIAEIRKRAFAANQSSDDERPLSFRELEDSDDGELIDDLPLIGSANGQRSLFRASRPAGDAFSSPLSSVPSNFDMTISLRTQRTSDRSLRPRRPTRTSARQRKPAPSFRLPLTIAESSASAGTTKTASFSSNRKKSQPVNPLHALLREKELEDRRGSGSAAVRLAEEAARQSSREASVGSDEDFDSLKRLRLADEQAAWKAVHESRKSSTPIDAIDVDDFTIGDRESKMLGAVAGEAIHKILAGDKDSKGKGKAQDIDQKMTLGVSLWTPFSDEDMEVDSMPIPSLSGHPILARLDGCLKSGDDLLFDLILRNGALAAVPREVLLSNIPKFLDIGLFASSQIADAVSFAFRDLWGLNSHKVQIPLVAILSTLVRLGVDPSVLEGAGLITEDIQRNSITHETLLKALRRLLSIVSAASFGGAFSSDDVANIVLILVIIGLDPLASSGELRTQLNITMDVVCNHGATDYLLRDIHEKVLNFATELVPADKARLVSLFASGSGRTRCIARRLAYSLIVSTPISPNDQAPPLDPLILLLSPDAGSCELFDLTNGSTDYEELRHHVNILSVALVDIAAYVEEERVVTKSGSGSSVQGSPGKAKKPAAPPLELLRGVLEVLQSKIVDTRAAHLDRSRTKAAIQRLTMRIYYERMALMGVRPRQRAATLKAYFSPQRQ